MGECGFAEAGWAVEEHVLGLVVATFGSRDEDPEVFLYTGLAHIFVPQRRAERLVERS